MSNQNLFFQITRLAGRLLLVALLAGSSVLARADEAARAVFVAGEALADGKPMAVGQAVPEGASVATGADGYVYLKTVDNGFLILRPNTQAKIVAYHIDRQRPENSRVKLELLGGVARSISGEGVKRAKQNFRFNTPVAAIGVRGTDFTVFTDQTVSRVAVVSGAVIVSPFAGECRPEGGGPCEGGASRELFASQQGQLLQVSKGQAIPLLMRGGGVAPDGSAPARADEPPVKSGAAGKGGAVLGPGDQSLEARKDAALQKDVLGIALPAPSPAPSQIVWGRWRAVLDQAANVDLIKSLDGSANLISLNNQFALLRKKTADWQVPRDGTMGFALQQSEAYILDEPRAALSAAKIENGRLIVDFAKASFSTSLDLSGQAGRFGLQAQGIVTPDGHLEGQGQFQRPTNMAVSGVLGAPNSGAAAYLFQSRLDDTHTATGATYWTKSP